MKSINIRKRQKIGSSIEGFSKAKKSIVDYYKTIYFVLFTNHHIGTEFYESKSSR